MQFSPDLGKSILGTRYGKSCLLKQFEIIVNGLNPGVSVVCLVSLV